MRCWGYLFDLRRIKVDCIFIEKRWELFLMSSVFLIRVIGELNFFNLFEKPETFSVSFNFGNEKHVSKFYLIDAEVYPRLIDWLTVWKYRKLVLNNRRKIRHKRGFHVKITITRELTVTIDEKFSIEMIEEINKTWCEAIYLKDKRKMHLNSIDSSHLTI